MWYVSLVPDRHPTDAKLHDATPAGPSHFICAPTVPAMTEQQSATVHTFRIDIVPRDHQNDPHLLAEAKHLGLNPTAALSHRYYLVRTAAEEVSVRKMAATIAG